LNFVLRRRRHYFRWIGEPMDFFKKGFAGDEFAGGFVGLRGWSVIVWAKGRDAENTIVTVLLNSSGRRLGRRSGIGLSVHGLAARRGSEKLSALTLVLVIALSVAVSIVMLTRIVCPHCRHVGATAASLPRVLICSQCGHGALIRSGKPPRSPTINIQEDAETGSASGSDTPPSESRILEIG
jgi:hypothetical protein